MNVHIIKLKMKIISTTPRTHHNIKQFKDLVKDSEHSFVEIYPNNQQFTSDEMKDILSDCHIAIIGDDEIDHNSLKNAINLTHIIKWGAGMDSIDFEATRLKSISVTNTPGILGKYVAEYVLGIIISTKRNLYDYTNSFKQKKLWNKSPGSSLFNKTIGIIGFGNIGQEISTLLRPFNTNVIFYDPYVESSQLGRKVKLDELFNCSDVLVLSSKLTDKTAGLINKENLIKLKKDCLLINISRGQVINEEDVFKFVDLNKLNYLFLDVFETEPPQLVNYYTENNNINFSQHNASNSLDAICEVNLKIVDMIKEYLN